MNQHLDTIPIWDAIRENGECPLCRVREKNELNYIDNFLGGSVMEPATRMEVNRKGFCARHFKMLYDAKNRLGLSLMADTHLQEIIARLEKEAPGAPKGGLFKKAAPAGPSLSAGCVLCERLDGTMERYALTLLYMWKKEEALRAALKESKGFCLGHYEQLIRLAPAELSGAQLTEFFTVLRELELQNLRRVEKELNWFTLKFDYRNQDKPWGDSRDAPERALNKLRGGTLPLPPLKDR